MSIPNISGGHLRPGDIVFYFTFRIVAFIKETVITGPTTYEVSAYGRQIKTLNPMEAMKYINQFAKHPVMPEYSEFKNMFQRDSNGYFWVPGWEDGKYGGFKIRRYEVYEHCVRNTSSSDRRFCGLYEFAVEPDWWFDLTTKNENQRPASKYHHFVWRYLSQRQKLQYPTDGYELIIDPEKQDRRNERLERNQYKMKFFPLYNPPDYLYKIYPFYKNTDYLAGLEINKPQFSQSRALRVP